MRILVESLKRLYNSNKITKEDIGYRVKSGKITEDEYKVLDGACTNIRVMLIASVNTAKQNRQA